jgi:hypothetical protein
MPDGAAVLPAVQIKVTKFHMDVVVGFDLTTGHVDSPGNAYHDTGTPRDPSTGAIRLVGASRALDDDFLVILEGNLVKE